MTESEIVENDEHNQSQSSVSNSCMDNVCTASNNAVPSYGAALQINCLLQETLSQEWVKHRNPGTLLASIVIVKRLKCK